MRSGVATGDLNVSLLYQQRHGWWAGCHQHLPLFPPQTEVMGVMGVLRSKEKSKNGKRRGWDLEEASHPRDWLEGKSP